MMTMDERVNIGQYAVIWCREQGLDARQTAERVAAAMFPELHGDKPGWIAPWEATEAMEDAADDPFHAEWKKQREHSLKHHGVEGFASCGFSTAMYRAMRDAYLDKGEGG